MPLPKALALILGPQAVLPGVAVPSARKKAHRLLLFVFRRWMLRIGDRQLRNQAVAQHIVERPDRPKEENLVVLHAVVLPADHHITVLGNVYPKTLCGPAVVLESIHIECGSSGSETISAQVDSSRLRAWDVPNGACFFAKSRSVDVKFSIRYGVTQCVAVYCAGF